MAACSTRNLQLTCAALRAPLRQGRDPAGAASRQPPGVPPGQRAGAGRPEPRGCQRRALHHHRQRPVALSRRGRRTERQVRTHGGLCIRRLPGWLAGSTHAVRPVQPISHRVTLSWPPHTRRCAILLDELDDYRGLRRGRALGHIVVETRTSNAVPLLRYSCSKRVIAMPTQQLNARRVNARALA